MPLVRTPAGIGEDGRPVYNYRQDPPDPTKVVVETGPIKGDFTLADGTVYNVSDDYVEVASAAHFGELSHHIGVRHEQDGHPGHQARNHPDYDPLVDEFHHVCTPHCGAVARTPAAQREQFAQRLQDLGHGHLVGTDKHAEVVERLSAAHQRHNSQEG
jgi:hypothetical protein